MVFFYFGADPSSWAFGNAQYSMASNLPASIQELWDQMGDIFQDKAMAGTRIDWMSTSPSGHYCVVLTDGTLYSNCPTLMAAIRTYQQQRPWVALEHVALHKSGAWVARFSDGTVQVNTSASARFPDSFTLLAAPYLQLSGEAAKGPQYSGISMVAFGANDSCLIKINNDLRWYGVSKSVDDDLKSVFQTGSVTIGKATVLCPYNPDYSFVELVSKWSWNTEKAWAWEFPPASAFQQGLFSEITEGRRPPPHLLPQLDKPAQTLAAPAPPPARTGRTPSPKPPPALPPRQPSTPSPAVQTPTTPAELTALVGRLFAESNNGKGYLTTLESSTVFKQLGDMFKLDRATLARIWNAADANKDGQFDQAEFVDAVMQMATTAGAIPGDTGADSGTAMSNGQGADNPDRYCDKAIACDMCRRTLLPGAEVWHCEVCNNGDFDACVSCYAKGTLCRHAPVRKTIRLRSAMSVRWTTGVISCSACARRFNPGSTIYYCAVCDNGDYDLCEPCYQNPFHSCPHTLELRIIRQGTGPVPGPGSGLNRPAPTHMSDFQGMSFGSPGAGTGPAGLPAKPAPSKVDKTSDVDKLTKKFQDTQLRDALMSSIVSEKPDVRWDDVAGLEQAKEELQEAIIFPQRFPQMYQGRRKARRAILLYGPPGTGKSYLAKAVANEVDHTLFSISSGDVVSKWHGESEGLVRQLFELAREKKPSVIFIDEIDALCSSRDGGGRGGDSGSESTARMKTEFLVQMDGVGHDNEGVLLLAATNLPWALDPAVRRRFQKRIHIPLPDAAARARLFRVHIGELGAGLRDADLTELARRTEGLSGSDIANAVQDALMVPIKKVHGATHFRTDGNNMYTPCQPGDTGAVAMTWKQVPPKRLREPDLTVGDFFQVLQGVKPSVGAEEIRKCAEWTQQYGLEGA